MTAPHWSAIPPDGEAVAVPVDPGPAVVYAAPPPPPVVVVRPYASFGYYRGGPYWHGWDIARGVAILPDGSGGFVLDGFGGLHPFGLNASAGPSSLPAGGPCVRIENLATPGGEHVSTPTV